MSGARRAPDDQPDEQPAEPEGLQREAASVAGDAGQRDEHEQEQVEGVHAPYRPTVRGSGPRPGRRRYTGTNVVTIAHISDPHVGSPYFVPNLMNRVIVELNELEPDVVICSGDLTNEGYRQEYKNWVAYAERIQAPMYTVPGNHDARNVGYLHFEELVGPTPLERRRQGRPPRRRGLERARHQRGPGRPRALHVDPRAVRGPGRPEGVRAAPPPAADPGHRARAQHRDGRGRPARGADPVGRQHRALGPQARPVRVAPRGPVRRQRRHGRRRSACAGTPSPATTSSSSRTTR